MSITTHEVEFVSDFIDGGYTAECSCGWSSKRYESMPKASEAADDHFDALFMEATELNTEAANQ